MGYYVFGATGVEGGTQLSDGSWLVPAGVTASMIGLDANLDGYPDGVTFAVYPTS